MTWQRVPFDVQLRRASDFIGQLGNDLFDQKRPPPEDVRMCWDLQALLRDAADAIDKENKR